MEEAVLLGHGSGGTMMKRIIEDVFFEAYAGDELLQGDDAAILEPFSSQGALSSSGASSLLEARSSQEIPSSPMARSSQETPSSSVALLSQETPSSPEALLSQEAPSSPEISTFSTDGRIAFSTDSFVVSPHFFPGGDIGRLAICGTVNDIATSGAVPLYLSCGFILEEGYPIADLKRICASMAQAAREAGVKLVTGDTKVVNRGHGDGVFINTSGIGVVPADVNLSGAFCQPGDKIIVSGTLGDHGITIMSCRETLSFSADIQSDAAPLNHLIAETLAATGALTEPGGFPPSAAGFPQSSTGVPPSDNKVFPHCANAVRCFRDPTRGGLASTLNELASQSGVDMLIEEEAIPVRPQVLGACDMLGYDVLQVANEGKMVCVVAPEAAEAALDAMHANPYGADAAIIGEVSQADPERGPKVYVLNAFGGRRILDMLVGEQLPRIC